MRKHLVLTTAIALALGLGLTGLVLAAADKGPEAITINPTAAEPKQPPVIFSHRAHQDTLKLACGECHHGADAGKQVPYKDGMKIEKCASCHNADKMPAQKDGKENVLATLKGAGHVNCQECHKNKVKEDAALKEKGIEKCKTCHVKK
ncbi:MAG: hypothetical protein BWK76_25245 [Desulfobulbaceae bacterium A2]|nr:MAG: hypothetical protein BWK76_25245 [Desulfobulbaceae bacterium A2]